MKNSGRITLTFLVIMLLIGSGVYALIKTVPVYIRWIEVKGAVEANMGRRFISTVDFEKGVRNKLNELNVNQKNIFFVKRGTFEYELIYTEPVTYFGKFTHVFQFSLKRNVQGIVQ